MVVHRNRKQSDKAMTGCKMGNGKISKLTVNLMETSYLTKKKSALGFRAFHPSLNTNLMSHRKIRKRKQRVTNFLWASKLAR